MHTFNSAYNNDIFWSSGLYPESHFLDTVDKFVKTKVCTDVVLMGNICDVCVVPKYDEISAGANTRWLTNDNAGVE